MTTETALEASIHLDELVQRVEALPARHATTQVGAALHDELAQLARAFDAIAQTPHRELWASDRARECRSYARTLRRRAAGSLR